MLQHRGELLFFRAHLKRAPVEHALQREPKGLHGSCFASVNSPSRVSSSGEVRFRVLPQEVDDLRTHPDALVELRIRALNVRAQLDQVGRLLIERQRFADSLRGLNLFRAWSPCWPGG